MAKATSKEECIARHRDYFDVHDHKGKLDSIQRARLEKVGAFVESGEKILDIGCNSGYIGEFVPEGCEIHGVDVAAGMVERAIRRGVHAKVAEAENLPYDDNEFDCAILGEIIEHVFDHLAVIDEALRVVKPGGKLIISTPHEAGFWGDRPKAMHRVEDHEHHVRCVSTVELKEICAARGDYKVETLVAKKRPQMNVAVITKRGE